MIADASAVSGEPQEQHRGAHRRVGDGQPHIGEIAVWSAVYKQQRAALGPGSEVAEQLAANLMDHPIWPANAGDNVHLYIAVGRVRCADSCGIGLSTAQKIAAAATG